MRKLAILGLAVIFLTAPALIAGEKAEMSEGQTKVAISVSGMSCGSCCTKVETAVAALDGVVRVKADYQKGVALVIYEKDKVNVDKIVEAINTKTSFKAKVQEEEKTS
jgi:copper chaperone CopZ